MSQVPCILMVDSDILVRQPIGAYLRECGYAVIEAASTDEALLILENGNPRIDIMLADVKASGSVDGFSLARWVRMKHPSIKVVLAGSVTTETAEAADLCDEGPKLATPYDPQVLLDRIKVLLASRDRNSS